MDTSFCLDGLEEATDLYGVPEIFNTDQGSQFTSEEFISALESRVIRISMDGEGRWKDNIFVERLWKTVKYEEVYLKAYDSLGEARSQLEAYFHYYNHRMRRQGLDGRTPDEVSFGALSQTPAAA
jgi:putative transposase